ncbi:small subunit processome component 20 homolog isoform X2 [Dysidea avara]|uniref:small subunit processome component 20 homolog isoform X2 n=1 Tax=Dysidea avara TaxID=196820 RepID=UPI00332DC89C
MEKLKKRKGAEKKVDFKTLFKFKSFSERIANIQIDVSHRVNEATGDGTEETHFSSALKKWRELDCTIDFVRFSQEVTPMVSSLPQLVHHKNEIVDTLKKHLQVQQNLAYEALLDLVVQLARDLQSDFYPHFKEFFTIITSLLRIQDASLIEQAFTTLAYLFKFLWRYLLKDIGDVFLYYSELLEESQKPHIKQFAAESIGFLLRKVRNHDNLFHTIFTALGQNPELSEGIGLVLFEMFKGVQQQFHSCTHKLLPILLGWLGPVTVSESRPAITDQFPAQQTFQSLCIMMQSMAEHTRREHCVFVFTTLQHQLELVSSHWRQEAEDVLVGSQLCYTLHLIGIWVSWRRGSRITDKSSLCKTLRPLMLETTLSEEVEKTLLHLVASLLLVSTVVEADLLSIIHNVFLTTRNVGIVLEFCKELLDWDKFNEVILPQCLSYCEAVVQQGTLLDTTEWSNFEQILQFLCELSLKRQPITVLPGQASPCEKLCLVPNPTRTKSKASPTESVIVKRLCEVLDDAIGQLSTQSSVQSHHMLWASFICLSHYRYDLYSVLRHFPIPPSLPEKLASLFSLLKQNCTIGGSDGVYLMAQCLHTMVATCSAVDLIIFVPFETITDLLKHFHHEWHVLSAVLAYQLHVVDQEGCSDQIDVVFPLLVHNLTSPLHKVRLLTLRILILFKQPLMENSEDMEEEDPTPCDIINLCLAAEETELLALEFRKNLHHLNKLHYSPHRFDRIPSLYKEVPLRYLIGNLYVNLSLLWTPIMELISGYAVDSNKTIFWSVYDEVLEITSSQKPVTKPEEPKTGKRCANLKEFYDYQQAMADWSVDDGRVDYHNCHFHLWKAMSQFPTMAEARSRVIVPRALHFINTCCAVGEECLQTTQDLQKHDTTTNNDSDTIVDSTVDMDTDDGGKVSDESSLQRPERGIALKVLKAMLELFSTFKSPKSVYKQSELYQLYLKLLTHHDSEIQKLALSCILTYKSANLIPYKENFFGLLDDKMFRAELSNFCFQSETCVVEDDHQTEVLSMLIRLLYGHMMQSGRGPVRGVGKRKIVLRFLSSCEGSISELINLVTLSFKQLTDQPLDQFTMDPTQVISLRKQRGFLVLLGQMMASFTPSQLCVHLPVLLAILIRLALCSSFLLDHHRHLVQSCFIGSLRAIRQLSINRISECFVQYQEFDFTPYKDDVLTAMVWPQIARLPNECAQSPTPLLKLLFNWSKQPKHYHLFQQSPNNSNLVILERVFTCLMTKGVTKSVTTIVMEMAYTLFEDETGLGIDLVLPHLDLILQYLNVKLKSGSKGCSLEMALLSKMSHYVTDSQVGTQLVFLLLPFVEQSSSLKSQDELNILLSVDQLLHEVDDIQPFVRPLSKLFFTLHGRKSRKAACAIFTTLSTKNESWTSVAEILNKVNAWNPKSIEEPNYDFILNGFTTAGDLIATFNEEQLLPILNNAVFFLLQSPDMSIRDSAAGFVVKLISATGPDTDKEKFKLLILGTLLDSTRQGLCSNSESAHHEFIAILAHLVKTYPSHLKFADMHQLLNVDPEQDFFENIKHIQLHRRTRALHRLSELCSSGTFSQSTMLNFLLPIGSHVIFASTTEREQNLISEAVNVLAAIAAHLKWTKYYFLLKNYLRLIPKRKQIEKNLIKAVVGILSGFHFDLKLQVETVTNTEPMKQDGVKEIVTNTEPMEQDGVKETVTNTEPMEQDGVKESVTNTEPMEQDGVKETVTNTELMEQDGVKEGEEVPELTKIDTTEEDTESQEEEKAKAFKIHTTITKAILPELQSCLTKRSNQSGHRLSQRKRDSNDPDTLQVPIALAMTQLLLQLPEDTLNSNLPGLLLKVCHTLRSYQRDVREVARNTLVKMASLLGPKYLHFILKEMKETLTKGYQVHVLSYSIHALLNGIKDQLTAGDIDVCLEPINEVLVGDLFGVAAEERREGEIASKLPEARASQSIKSYEILAMFLSPSMLPQLLTPLKETLDTQPNTRVFQTVENVLKSIGTGLQTNTGFTITHLLHFVHDLLSNNLPVFAATTKKPPDPSPAGCRPPSIYLLPPEPVQRSHKPASQGNRASAHIITEFGLQILLTLLKRGKVDSKDNEHLQMMDPFVELLTNLLTSRHPTVLTMVLRCITWMLRLTLPSLDTHIATITASVFDVLRNYARAGASASGSNQKLVTSAFKAMTVLVRDCISQEISDAQLKLLLTFIEEDIYDYQRQTTAFPLLRAILGRKFITNQIHEVMNKVAQLSITSESDSVQLQCRKAVLQFLLDYKLKKKLQSYLDLFISNLNFEVQSGRESVLEMLSVIFAKFPKITLCKLATYFFIPLASRLINDDSPTCRSMVAEATKVLITNVNAEKKTQLFNIVIIWTQSTQVLQRRLGVQLVGIFCEAEGSLFSKRVSLVIPLLSECLDVPDEQANDTQSTPGDHLTFCTLSTLYKLLETETIRGHDHADHMMEIWAKVQQLLSHAHTWVQLTACKLFSWLFNTYKTADVTSESSGYFSVEGAQKVGQLVTGFCGQLRSANITADLAVQVVKNLVFLAKVLLHMEENDHEPSLSWLISKMVHIATYEAGHYPKQSLKRSCVFKWIAAVAVELGTSLPDHLPQLLAPLYREESDIMKAAGEELHLLALEVIELIKTQVGRENFARAYTHIQQEVQTKRLVRKRQRALEAIADPSKKALRKMKKNELKKASKRRKILKHRPNARWRVTLGE